MDATWQLLGRAAGTKSVGVNRVRVAPGKLPTPPHSHGASEELYYILGGSGLAWQDEEVHEVRPGDCVIQRADEHEHTLDRRRRRPGRISSTARTTRPSSAGCRARARSASAGRGRRAATDDPWDIEASSRRSPTAIPRRGRRTSSTSTRSSWRSTGRSYRAACDAASAPTQAGLHWERIDPGKHGSVAALPLRGRGDLRDPRGRRHARAVARSRCRCHKASCAKTSRSVPAM